MNTGIVQALRANRKYWFYPLIPVVGIFAVGALWASVFLEFRAADNYLMVIQSQKEALSELHSNVDVLVALAVGGTLVILPFCGLLMWVLRRLRAKTALLRGQREFFRELLDNIPIGISVRQLKADGSGTYVLWNETNAVMYGVSKEAVLEQPISATTAPRATVDQVLRWDAELMASPAVQEVTETLRQPGREASIIHRLRAPVFNANDAVEYVITVSEDVTRKRAVEDGLRLASKVFETTADGIVISDREDRVIRVNAAFTRLTGHTQAEMENHRVFDSPFTPLDREESGKRMDRLRTEGAVTAQIQRRHKDGSELDLWLTATSVLDADGEVVNYVRIFSDISQIRSAQLRLEQLANADALTGLPNRRVFSDRIEQALLHAERSNTGVALLFLDLDGFKDINDSCGHDVGDQLLKVVARRLASCIRSSDTLCRLGGDEFTVILGDVGEREGAMIVADSITRELTRPILIGKRRLQVGTSIGIVLYPEHGGSSVELISRADAAMYQAKNAGGNRYVIFGDTQQKVQLVQKVA